MKGRGPWAEYCIAKSDNIAVKPEVWDFKEAAACALAGGVAVSMVNSAKDVANKKCLVIGASDCSRIATLAFFVVGCARGDSLALKVLSLARNRLNFGR
jgi:D-arabinose 1-dehydrogenase-like Zn-dependent alcohol dehydrogenase